MLFFTILGTPLFTLWVLSIGGFPNNDESGLSIVKKQNPVGSLLRGLAFSLPVLILMIILRRLIPLSYRPFKLYLYYLIRDHLFPFLPLLLLCLTAFRARSFQEFFLFAAGFYSFLTLGELFMNYGRFELYNVVLLPVMRMGIMLFFSLLILYYEDWYGYRKMMYLLLMLLLPLLGGLVTYLYMRFQTLLAIAGAMLFFSGGILFLLLNRDNLSPGRSTPRPLVG